MSKFRNVKILIFLLFFVTAIPFVLAFYDICVLRFNNIYVTDSNCDITFSQMLFLGSISGDEIESISVFKDSKKYCELDNSINGLQRRRCSNLIIGDKENINQIVSYFDRNQPAAMQAVASGKKFPTNRISYVLHLFAYMKNRKLAYIKIYVFEVGESTDKAWCSCFGTNTHLECNSIMQISQLTGFTE
jgi:hypothetical protein